MNQHSHLELLEPRLLFSADGLDIGADMTARLEGPLSVVLIDASLADAHWLAQGVDADAHTVFFDSASGSDAILGELSQIVSDSGRAVDSVSILSHGSAGSFSFASGHVDAASLEGDGGLFWARIAQVLTEEADIGIFACNVAQDAGLGASLVDQLSALSGADVFVSDDLTGAGGDWVLEVASAGAADEPDSLEFGLNLEWLAQYDHALAQTVSGRVMEDVDGDGSISDDGQGVSGATVLLYEDGGDGTMDAGDALLSTTTTDALGQYSFAGLADGTYWVVIDSRTIAPSAGFNAGWDQGDVWAEQTYGSAGAVFLNGGYDYLSTAGSLMGGLSVDTSDDASILLTSQHLTRAVVSGADVTGLDSGFSFQVVTTTLDGDDDGGADRSVQGSLRQFIQNSNAIAGTQTSRFALSQAGAGHVYYQDDGLAGSLTNIVTTTQSDAAIGDFDADYVSGGFSWWRFQPGSTLPVMTDTVNLNGTTQQGWTAGQPIIEIDAVNMGDGEDVLSISGAGSEIRGLVVHDSWDAIQLTNADGVTIAGNFLGTDVTGTLSGGSGGEGIDIDASSNVVIGGADLADRNVISAMGNDGIEVDTASSGLIVQNNYIGTNVAGTADLGNGSNGVQIYGPGAQVLDNVISGNVGNGIMLGNGADGFVVQGNLIGTDPTGTVLVENDGNDLYLNKADNGLIGGYDASQRNIISVGTSGGGIKGFSSVDNITVLNNYIGLDITGQHAFGDYSSSGIMIQGGSGWQIGDVGAGNVIAGQNIGIHLYGSATHSHTIQGNILGTDATGQDVFGFGLWGVWMQFSSSDNLIGGTGAGEGNLIAGAEHDGVSLNSSSGTLGNRILGNTIYATGMFPIDLESDTFLENDADESDGWQNHPVLASAIRGHDGLTTITGTLTSTANTTFRVELFIGSELNSYGMASGRTFLCSLDVTTDAAGQAELSHIASGLIAGQYISATATGSGTSEYSRPFAVEAAASPDPQFEPGREDSQARTAALSSPSSEPASPTASQQEETSSQPDQETSTAVETTSNQEVSETDNQAQVLSGDGEESVPDSDSPSPEEPLSEDASEDLAHAGTEAQGEPSVDALAESDAMETRNRRERRRENPRSYAHAEVDLEINGQGGPRQGDLSRIDAAPMVQGANVVYMNINGLDGLKPGQIVSPKAYGTLGDSGRMWNRMRSDKEIADHARATRARMKDITVGAVVGVSAVASMGYLVWSIKSGALISSFVAALPSWRVFDPLPVLDFADKKRQNRTEGDRKKHSGQDADVLILTAE